MLEHPTIRSITLVPFVSHSVITQNSASVPSLQPSITWALHCPHHLCNIPSLTKRCIGYIWLTLNHYLVITQVPSVQPLTITQVLHHPHLCNTSPLPTLNHYLAITSVPSVQPSSLHQAVPWCHMRSTKCFPVGLEGCKVSSHLRRIPGAQWTRRCHCPLMTKGLSKFLNRNLGIQLVMSL